MLYYEDLVIDEVATSPSYTVTKEEIIEFAGKWDPQPFHTDEVEAEKWPLGLTASSVHTIAISSRLCNQLQTKPTAAVAGLGWNNIKMHQPVRPGDELHIRAWVSDKRLSNSQQGMGIFVNQIEVVNQDQVVVLSYDVATLVLTKEGGKTLENAS